MPNIKSEKLTEAKGEMEINTWQITRQNKLVSVESVWISWLVNLPNWNVWSTTLKN